MIAIRHVLQLIVVVVVVIVRYLVDIDESNGCRERCACAVDSRYTVMEYGTE
ncbi:hypothetical protein BU24DRAFT_418141 [Aaosphaeria arxii CBS 175.79]|uniref:Uncharacterized protein n=1 Tax=Aaosphaeria arxii CBS 175.79 TaxID=1450172 RepID=A0A6A5Y130_9PLEO|nr:uncharacterized protein BU24DRAFT_418141 [Aaosphaeria arxii CBS 175.79]KAF2018621.1 hypothetical protein BU24DRAFT_418141 [Aaosphaeria arxii CBS 175.79]